MADHAELRRLAEAARAEPSSLVKVAAYLYALDDPDTTIALLDAAERAERAIELLRKVVDTTDQYGVTYAPEFDKAVAFLAEVDRAE